MEEDDEWWENEEDEEEEEVSWEKTNNSSRVSPKTLGGSTLATLLESPPPISILKSDFFTPPTFACIQETAAARKHWSNIKIHTPQRKLEAAMQHMVQSIEQQDPQFITTAAALVRSAWEDVNQIRREQIADKQRAKLDKRQDDVRPRLLTAEEENKIKQGQGKGKGKGKGKGYWQSRTRSTQAEEKSKASGAKEAPTSSNPREEAGTR